MGKTHLRTERRVCFRQFLTASLVSLLNPRSIHIPSPRNGKVKLTPASSPQVGRLRFQDDAVGLVVQDDVADVAAVEAGPGRADTAGQEGVHGRGLVGTGDVHGRGRQRPLPDDLVDVSHGLEDSLLVPGENAQQHLRISDCRNDLGIKPSEEYRPKRQKRQPTDVSPQATCHSFCACHVFPGEMVGTQGTQHPQN